MKPILSSKFAIYGISLLVSLLFFDLIFGFSKLLPTNFEWLMGNNDWPQHYLGWEFFRASPWGFPIIGKMEGIFYPFESSVGFTDSIPLLSIFFKVIRFMLPSDFQFIGLWFFITFNLNFLYSYKFACAINEDSNRYTNLILSLFLAFSPVLLFRLGHPALCAHWLFIGIMSEFLVKDHSRSIIKSSLFLILSSLVHPYLTVICFVLHNMLIIYLIRSGKVYKNTLFVYLIQLLIIPIWYSIGYFEFEINKSAVYHHSYLTHSHNLNSLFNSFGNSIIFDELKVYNYYQYEAFAFLGSTVILMTVFAFIYFCFKGFPEKNILFRNRNKWLTFGCILLWILSISNEVSFGDVLLVRIKLDAAIKDKIETFRSIGRFFWPMYYLISIYCLRSFYLVFTKRQILLNTILTLLFVLQIMDLRSLYNYIKNKEKNISCIRSQPEAWEKLVNKKKSFLLFPGYKLDYIHGGDYINFLYLAHHFNMNVNTGYFARVNNELLNRTKLEQFQKVVFCDFDSSALYVTNDFDAKWFKIGLNEGFLTKTLVDGYNVFTPIKPRLKKSSVFLDVDLFQTKFELQNFNGENFFITNGGKGDHLQYGPFIPLETGKYKVNFLVSLESSSGEGAVITLDVCGMNGSKILSKLELQNKDFILQSNNGIPLEFKMDQPLIDVEFRVFSNGLAKIKSRGVVLEKL